MNNILSILKSLSQKADLTLSQAEDAYKLATALPPEDRLLPLLAIAQRMPKLITAQVTGSEASKAHRLLTAMHLLLAKDNFESFLFAMESEREPRERFYIPRRKVLLPVVNKMQELSDKDNPLELLTVSMPPGSGKSTLGEFYISWVTGRDPKKPSLGSACSDTLTTNLFKGVYSMMTDPTYLYKDIFPYTVEKNAKFETLELDGIHPFASMTFRAINGTLTGATRCESLLYADDLCSGIEEALNPQRLEKLWNLYTNDLKSRKKDGAVEIHIATRWSTKDVIGRLEEKYANSKSACFIKLPALNENDESNFEYLHGVGFSKKYFIDMRENLDPVSWQCLFQNDPIERTGLLFPKEDLRVEAYPDDDPDATIAVIDTKAKGTDYFCAAICAIYGDDLYIKDFVFSNDIIENIVPHCIDKLKLHNVSLCKIESNNGGWAVANLLKEACPHITFIEETTTANKETKIISEAGNVKKSCVFLPEQDRDEEYKDAIKWLCGYATQIRNKHDDVPDALSMLIQFVREQFNLLNNVEIMDRII